MKIALGIIVSSGFRPDTDFLFGRAPEEGQSLPPEGLFALQERIVSGKCNTTLPPDRKISSLRLIMSRKFPTDVARNEICAAVLKGDEDYLLFLDADMVHPADLLERLLAHDKPVITARYHLKKPPFAAIAYVKHRTQEGPHRYASIHFGKGVFEIERFGAGALLIRRDVLEAIDKRQRDEWAGFLLSSRYDAIPEFAKSFLPDRPTCQWFRYQHADGKSHDPRIDMHISEDFWFGRQAREAGFSCWCDWDIDIPHIGPMAIDASWNFPFLNKQVGEYENPEHRDMVLANTIVRGYDGGMVLGEHPGYQIDEYKITPGER